MRRERTEVEDKWREVAVQLTLPRTWSKMGLSTPSCQEFQSLVGFIYFLLHKGAEYESPAKKRRYDKSYLDHCVQCCKIEIYCQAQPQPQFN